MADITPLLTEENLPRLDIFRKIENQKRKGLRILQQAAREADEQAAKMEDYNADERNAEKIDSDTIACFSNLRDECIAEMVNAPEMPQRGRRAP